MFENAKARFSPEGGLIIDGDPEILQKLIDSVKSEKIVGEDETVSDVVNFRK